RRAGAVRARTRGTGPSLNPLGSPAGPGASERRRSDCALAPEGGTKPGERFGRRVDEVEQAEVLLRDHPVADERREVHDLAPAARPVEQGHDRPLELAGLAERQDLEQLVERAEAAGEDDDGP